MTRRDNGQRQRHGNSAAWVAREAQRLFPLDLCARLDWLYEEAHAATYESDRHAIFQTIRRLRNGEDAS